jgi:hypothetical protein
MPLIATFNTHPISSPVRIVAICILTVLSFEYLLEMLLPVQQHEVRPYEQYKTCGNGDLPPPLLEAWQKSHPTGDTTGGSFISPVLVAPLQTIHF